MVFLVFCAAAFPIVTFRFGHMRRKMPIAITSGRLNSGRIQAELVRSHWDNTRCRWGEVPECLWTCGAWHRRNPRGAPIHPASFPWTGTTACEYGTGKSGSENRGQSTFPTCTWKTYSDPVSPDPVSPFLWRFHLDPVSTQSRPSAGRRSIPVSASILRPSVEISFRCSS